MRLLPATVLAALAFVVAACSSASSGGSTSGGADGTQAVSSCKWPSSLDPPADAGTGGWGWTVGRYLLTCKDGPDFEGCVSNDPSTCPGTNAIPNATLSDCVDQCDAGEYVVAAGGPPQLSPDGGIVAPPSPTLPSGCRFLTANPGGVEYSCCPCE